VGRNQDQSKLRRLLIAMVGFAVCLPAFLWTIKADQPFFPGDVVDEFDVKWYSPHLKAMKEPSLWRLSQTDPKATVFRFLWLPTFHGPTSVRLERFSDSAVLCVVRLDKRAGYEPGGINILKSKKLTEKQRQEFEQRLDRAKFWDLPTDEGTFSGTDGDRLILEGVMNGEYHVVHRDTPALGSDFVELCRFLLDLSGLNVMKSWDEYRPDPRQ
jgi:hypothetical protein